MEFRTKVPVKKLDFALSHSDRMVVIGSCFAENIGKRLKESGFKASVNPFGVVFNPVSVYQSLRRLMEGRRFEQNELFEHQGLFHSFSHHSSFSGENAQTTLNQMNQAFDAASDHLKKTNRLMITFGTAWLYTLVSNNQVVANCHKVPASDFNRSRLSVEEIATDFKHLFSMLFQQNPALKILLTVSPIRHLKDGIHENTLSKSILHLAVEQLCSFDSRIVYFPSYELMMDDLRDYRFYADDYMHPTDMAQQYIWEHFCSSCMDHTTIEKVKQIRQIHRAMAHRPFKSETEEYRRFIIRNIAEIDALKATFPDLDLSDEKRFFEQKL